MSTSYCVQKSQENLRVWHAPTTEPLDTRRALIAFGHECKFAVLPPTPSCPSTASLLPSSLPLLILLMAAIIITSFVAVVALALIVIICTVARVVAILVTVVLVGAVVALILTSVLMVALLRMVLVSVRLVLIPVGVVLASVRLT